MTTTDIDIEGLTPAQAMRAKARRNRGFIYGAAVLALITLAAVFAPLLTPYDFAGQVLTDRLLPPVWAGGGWEHPLGTDHLGRDYLARLLYGARISLAVGFLAASIGCVLGVTLGVVAGYYGGRVDQAISFILSCQLALPSLLIAMALVFLIGPSVPVVIAVIGFLHWGLYLVISRTATQRLRQQEFVAAAQALGAPVRSILWGEILPNLISRILVVFTYEVGSAILAEASLSFLGVGIPSPMPSWGLMIAEGKNAIFFQPWLVIIPGAALFVLVIAINLMGDALRDITAPEGRN
ncbi:ABC transporter permease [Leisingera thetidis]|uniref:ABC transporter permease n=1 Tax=Leisingera thetidis TaxID=2930199 RepID=UPI0021F72720|nr:ABC transporter permease [Leisingera thetidis]